MPYQVGLLLHSLPAETPKDSTLRVESFGSLLGGPDVPVLAPLWGALIRTTGSPLAAIEEGWMREGGARMHAKHAAKGLPFTKTRFYLFFQTLEIYCVLAC